MGRSRIEQDKTIKMIPQHIVSKFLQACCVLCLYVITIAGVTYVFAVAGLYFLYFRPQFLPIAALYLAWMVVDQKQSKQGGRKVGVDFVGDLAVFRYSRDYYPISLEKTVDLDSCKNYIFGYHPHGFIPEGLVISFGTKVLDFQSKFPGITPHIGRHSCEYNARGRRGVRGTTRKGLLTPGGVNYGKRFFCSDEPKQRPSFLDEFGKRCIFCGK